MPITEHKPYKLTMQRFGARVQFEYATLLEAVRFALGCVEENTAAPERLSEHGVVIWKQDGDSPSSICDALDRLRAMMVEERPALAPDTAHLLLGQEEAWLVLRVRDWAQREGRVPCADLRAAEIEFARYLNNDDGHRSTQTSKDETAMGERKPGGSQ